MCRPIESRDSLGAMGPAAAAALFAGYQPTRTKSSAVNNLMDTNPMNSIPVWPHDALPPPWPPSAVSINTPSPMTFESGHNPNDMIIMSMAAPPPSLPFVSFPKNIPMPWMNASASLSSEPISAFSIQDDLKSTIKEKMVIEMKESMEDIHSGINDELEAAELKDLLEFTVPDDMNLAEKDKEELIHLDDGFDGTEMSILYSFLVDNSEEKPPEKKTFDGGTDDGILNLDLINSSPMASVIDSLDEDFTDEDLRMTPPLATPVDVEAQNAKVQIKSRRLCRADGCYKRSRSNGLCISHGGGRRCAIEGCEKSSQGGNLCIRHGGGKRCGYDGCGKAAQSNFLCKAHGGGPRCQYPNCSRSSQGGGYCRSHGGGKRCMLSGCMKGTQRGDYCALHGGSRLCEVPGCLRNDRGGGFCATHGGGKRCSLEGCEKPCRRKGLCSAHLRHVESGNHSKPC